MNSYYKLVHPLALRMIGIKFLIVIYILYKTVCSQELKTYQRRCINIVLLSNFMEKYKDNTDSKCASHWRLIVPQLVWIVFVPQGQLYKSERQW